MARNEFPKLDRLDFKEEDYPGGVGLLPDQKDYDQLWNRGKPIHFGRVTSELVGFILRPKLDESSGFPVVKAPFSPDKPIVSVDDVEVITMRDRPLNSDLVRGRTMFTECLVLRYREQGFGGTPDTVMQGFEYTNNPRQERQHFDQETWTESLYWRGDPGEFVVRKGERWLDLCVGRRAYTKDPVVAARIPIEHEHKIEILGKVPRFISDCGGKPKDPDSPQYLAAIKPGETVIGGKARLDRQGNPEIERYEYGGVLNVTRYPRELKSLNVLRSVLLDWTLDDREKRSVISAMLEDPYWEPAVEPETVYPTLLVQLSAADRVSLVPRVSANPPDWLFAEIVQGLGSRGDFRIRAEHSGVVGEVRDCPTSEHLLEVEIGEQSMLVPKSARLLVTQGQTIAAGDMLGDFVARQDFGSWSALEALAGPAACQYILEAKLADKMICPDQATTKAAKRLIDARLLPEAKGPRFLDLRSAMEFPYWRAHKHIVLPPLAEEEATQEEFSVNGVTYRTRSTIARARQSRGHDLGSAPKRAGKVRS